MNVQPISTDDTNLQHDFDFGSLSGMSSPVLSEFSDIMAPIDNGRDALPSSPSDPLSNSITNLQLPIETLASESLSSFIPIIEHLPGLILENNLYHVKQPLLKTELQQLRSFTQTIGELTLTDTESVNYPNVAPETLSRLALIQDPDSPFLPYLKSLRLVDADEALVYYLFFCVTSSLTVLEISHVPSTRQITVACFLEELVLNARQLSNITLGPGRLSESSLQNSLKFTHLRQLHIIDAADSLDFEFLRNVSLLPELESFIIDARTAEYQQRAFQSAADPLTLISGSMVPLLSVEGRTPITTGTDSAIPFRQLRKLAITANVVLMGDLVYYLFPQGVKEISLTLVQNGLTMQLPLHWDRRRTEASASDIATITDDSGMPEPDAPILHDGAGNSVDNPLDATSHITLSSFPDSASMNLAVELQEAVVPLVVAPDVTLMPEQPTEAFDPVPAEPSAPLSKKKKARRPIISCENCRRKEEERQRRVEEEQAHRRWEEEERERREREEEQLRVEREARENLERTTEEWLRAEREAREEQERISNVMAQTAFFAYVIEEILTVGSPDIFLIDRLEMPSYFDFAPVASSFDFPSPTLQMLLSCPTLRELQFYHWILTSVDESFVDLAATSSTRPMSMEKLQLPVDASLNSGIMISTLHQIAQYYPRLTHLESLIRQIPAVADSPLNLGAGFIPHGLEVLSVGGGSPSTKDKIDVSTYLSLLFPDLKDIETHEGYDEDDWKFIHTLVEMCQKVRCDERLRHRGAQ